MKNEVKSIVAFSAGVAVSAAITFGINISDIKANERKFNDKTDIYYDIDESSKAEDIYGLYKNNNVTLCYKDVYYDSNHPIASIIGLKDFQLYGYYSLDSEELVCVEGMEKDTGYEVKPLDEIIDYDNIQTAENSITVSKLHDIVDNERKR